MKIDILEINNLLDKEIEFAKQVNPQMAMGMAQIKKIINKLNAEKETGNEKQEFELGDTAYMIDEDYKCFESTVFRITLNRKGIYDYDTYDADFGARDIGEWVFKSEQEREMYLRTMFSH
ncbi:regulator [Marinisporobacter balticus]|uniref:Uncharacterized protein n=1 Tax=Marinisporobacter balticus TaxID=2018667 RepID=A0A4R2K833_9FIRM|nr:regulator [Marinisporobacter balticus]TCO69531.1 hypothetical protein EV214_13155 [Marinisporobacter balticus]